MGVVRSVFEPSETRGLTRSGDLSLMGHEDASQGQVKGRGRRARLLFGANECTYDFELLRKPSRADPDIRGGASGLVRLSPARALGVTIVGAGTT
eukprot:8207832-Pyramimonas_sp.AAC.1